jgi:hypothetical protein
MKRLIKKHTVPASGDPLTAAAERHLDSRIAGPFQARVRGADARGQGFEIRTVLDDLSARDFNLRLTRHVDPGSRLFVLARVHEATLALRGMVQRIEPDNGFCVVTVVIDRYRFVSSFADS